MSSDMKFVSIVVGVAVLAVVGFFIFGKKATPSNPPIEPAVLTDAGQLIREDSPVRGPEGAKVTIVEFADFQCPACQAAKPVILSVLENNPTTVKLVFRHFPISSIHIHADETALAAEAAKNQGKFWEMYDKLFDTQEEWGTVSKRKIGDFLKTLATDFSLDVDKFSTDKDGEAVRNVVARDMADGDALGVTGTPTFFVNGQKIGGTNELEAAVAAALQ